MKINEFSNDLTLKTSPYIDDMSILIDKAKEAVSNENVEIENVSINKILATQPLNVPPEHQSVEIFSDYDDLPFSVLVDGFYHVLDGHHRIMEDMEQGFTEITMYVAIPDELSEGKKDKKQSTKTPVIPFAGFWWHNSNEDQNNDNSGQSDSFGSAGDAGGE